MLVAVDLDYFVKWTSIENKFFFSYAQIQKEKNVCQTYENLHPIFLLLNDNLKMNFLGSFMFIEYLLHCKKKVL